MSLDRLGHQLDASTQWKRTLATVLVRYRSWLAANRFATPAVEARLARAFRQLRSEQLTLAFVGEFSRGKTELINALFFAGCGQRILPSQPGRTTMFPTELFFDTQAGRPYLRLLPIETRLGDIPLAELRQRPEAWVTFNLNAQHPGAMAEAFAEVARVKTVSRERALRLGFDPATLESAGAKDRVRIPAWRHALASIDHPLLRQGLRVLDTPGLNALGSEPELTLSMLPEAQVVFFLLAADTGVTASDLAIWEAHVRNLSRQGAQRLYALLNKADVFEDELQEPDAVQANQDRIRRETAAYLGLGVEQVMLVSARQGLLAQVRNDQSLLTRSRFSALESLLGERLVADRGRLMTEQVVTPLGEMLAATQAMLEQRLVKVQEQQHQLAAQGVDQDALLTEIGGQARTEQDIHHKQLIVLRGQHKLLRRQAELLQQTLHPDRLDSHLEKVRRRLLGSWTTIGINQGIVAFFNALDADLGHLSDEAAKADRTVAAIYRRHNELYPLLAMDAPRLALGPFVQELRHLRVRADDFRLRLSTLLTEQHSLARCFLETLAQSVVELHLRLRNVIEDWEAEVLLPLVQFNQERKQLIEQQLLALRVLAQSSRQIETRSQRLAQYAEQLAAQREEIQQLAFALRRARPAFRQGNALGLSLVN